MTPEERAEWAVQRHPDSACNDSMFLPIDLKQHIAAAVRAAVAEEREACARICDGSDDIPNGTVWAEGKEHCEFLAAAIRARGETADETTHPQA